MCVVNGVENKEMNTVAVAMVEQENCCEICGEKLRLYSLCVRKVNAQIVVGCGQCARMQEDYSFEEFMSLQNVQ